MNKEQLRQAGPLLFIFIFITALCIAGKNWLEKNGISQELVLSGNLILALVSGLAYYVNLRSLRSPNPQAPVRGMYGGFILKFFVLALAAFIYIMLAKENVNKAGLMILAGLYILYTAFETRALMQLTRKKKNG